MRHVSFCLSIISTQTRWHLRWNLVDFVQTMRHECAITLSISPKQKHQIVTCFAPQNQVHANNRVNAKQQPTVQYKPYYYQTSFVGEVCDFTSRYESICIKLHYGRCNSPESIRSVSAIALGRFSAITPSLTQA